MSEKYIDEKVGTLAKTQNHLIAFEYDSEWLEHGFSISPFSLPLRKEVFIPKGYDLFEGLFGVFSDSLPDGWGRLLVDRLLLKNHINPDEAGSLTSHRIRRCCPINKLNEKSVNINKILI